jgi:hypothetical protein
MGAQQRTNPFDSPNWRKFIQRSLAIDCISRATVEEFAPEKDESPQWLPDATRVAHRHALRNARNEAGYLSAFATALRQAAARGVSGTTLH